MPRNNKMSDIITDEQRSHLMSLVKNRDTKIEMMVRSKLHSRGFRFRKNVNQLPGKPDVVLPKYNAVIFIHGCFWHGHSNCIKGKLPSTKVEFWTGKISDNKTRDQYLKSLLFNVGWRIAVVWECAYANRERCRESTDILCKWITSDSKYCEIPS